MTGGDRGLYRHTGDVNRDAHWMTGYTGALHTGNIQGRTVKTQGIAGEERGF